MSDKTVVIQDYVDRARERNTSLEFTTAFGTRPDDVAFYRVFIDGLLMKNGFVNRVSAMQLRDFLDDVLAGDEKEGETFTKADMDRVYESGREAGLRDARDEFERIAYTYRENIRYARKD